MEDSVKEVKTILQSLVDTALGKRAKNEKEEEKEDKKEIEKEEIVENEDIDKRKEMGDVGGFLKSKGLSDEDIEHVYKLMEKIAYDKSTAKTADNEEDKKEEDKKEKDKEKVENCKNKAKNVDKEKDDKEEKEVKYEDFKKEVAEEAEKEVENCKAKAKNSLEDLKAAFFEGKVEKTNKYMTQKQGIELGKELY